MDGENAWEYYPQNGWDFLHTLYARLAEHPNLRLTTFSDVLEDTRPQELPSLCAGSWVYGTFSTWIGDSAKNRAWEMLAEAKRAVDSALESFDDEAQPEWAQAVQTQLAICEASDWFWWMRADDQSEDESAFDALFRQQLAELYRLIDLAPPNALEAAIGGGTDKAPTGPDVATGAMHRSN